MVVDIKARITCIRRSAFENILTDGNGDKVQLKPGAEVKVTVEAEPEATTPHDEKGGKVAAG
jgi:hypothetical protein